jgi:hypothetical protein
LPENAISILSILTLRAIEKLPPTKKRVFEPFQAKKTKKRGKKTRLSQCFFSKKKSIFLGPEPSPGFGVRGGKIDPNKGNFVFCDPNHLFKNFGLRLAWIQRILA